MLQCLLHHQRFAGAADGDGGDAHTAPHGQRGCTGGAAVRIQSNHAADNQPLHWSYHKQVKQILEYSLQPRLLP